MFWAQIKRQRKSRCVNTLNVRKLHFHRRHRSRSVSACRNLKRRQNVRRLISLKEEEICFQKSLKLTFPSVRYIFTTSSTRGLKGGGKENKRTTWDHRRLAKAVSLVSERETTSKKDLWYAIAQEYFG